jgi:hypothetical protein
MKIIKQVATKVTLTETHDRLAVVGKFPNGETIRWSLTRNGERFSLGALPERAISEAQMQKLFNLMKFRDGETSNGIRFARLAKEVKEVDSIDQLLAA